jgi:hypothetical protein
MSAPSPLATAALVAFAAGLLPLESGAAPIRYEFSGVSTIDSVNPAHIGQSMAGYVEFDPLAAYSSGSAIDAADGIGGVQWAFLGVGRLRIEYAGGVIENAIQGATQQTLEVIRRNDEGLAPGTDSLSVRLDQFRNTGASEARVQVNLDLGSPDALLFQDHALDGAIDMAHGFGSLNFSAYDWTQSNAYLHFGAFRIIDFRLADDAAAPVPEPGSLALAALALALTAGAGRTRRV